MNTEFEKRKKKSEDDKLYLVFIVFGMRFLPLALWLRYGKPNQSFIIFISSVLHGTQLPCICKI